jgi:hypothetical protein
MGRTKDFDVFPFCTATRTGTTGTRLDFDPGRCCRPWNDPSIDTKKSSGIFRKMLGDIN